MHVLFEVFYPGIHGLQELFHIPELAGSQPRQHQQYLYLGGVHHSGSSDWAWARWEAFTLPSQPSFAGLRFIVHSLMRPYYQVFCNIKNIAERKEYFGFDLRC